MNFDLSDEQKQMAEELRRLLTKQSSSAHLRQLLERGSQFDQELWSALAQMGVTGIGIAEEAGGIGLNEIDLCVALEELGRANAAVPLSASLGLAAQAIQLGGNEAQRRQWLPRIASGEVIASFAYAEGASDVWSGLPACVFEQGRLNGTKAPVAELAIAQLAVVAASQHGRPVLALLDLSGAGIERSPLTGFDQLRGHGDLRLSNVAAELLQSADHAALQRLLDRAAILAAFEQIGGAEACVFMARDYSLGRQVFGRSLASYQAVKHKLARILVQIELARSNAWYAAWALVNGAADLQTAAAAARLSACEAFEQAARENIQVHGGIGYTWEADCHFYYRRERLLAAALGASGRWSGRLIDGLSGARAAVTA